AAHQHPSRSCAFRHLCGIDHFQVARRMSGAIRIVSDLRDPHVGLFVVNASMRMLCRTLTLLGAKLPLPGGFSTILRVTYSTFEPGGNPFHARYLSKSTIFSTGLSSDSDTLPSSTPSSHSSDMPGERFGFSTTSFAIALRTA